MTARRDRGAAVVWSLVLVVVLVMMSAAVLVVVGAGAARQRAVGAADLAALAGAGPGGCAAAAVVAEANGAVLLDCRAEAGDVVVVVRVVSGLTTPTGEPVSPVATARAGPPQR